MQKSDKESDFCEHQIKALWNEHQIKALAQHLVQYTEYKETRERIHADIQERREVCFQMLHRYMRRLNYPGAAGFAHENPEKFQEIFQSEFIFAYSLYYPSRDPHRLVGKQLHDYFGGEAPPAQYVNYRWVGEEASDDEAGAPCEESRREYSSAVKETAKTHQSLSKRMEEMEETLSKKFEETLSSRMGELTKQIDRLLLGATAVPAVSHKRNEPAGCGVSPRVLPVRIAETENIETQPARLDISPGDPVGAENLEPLTSTPMSAGPPAGTPPAALSPLKSNLSSEAKLSEIQASENREAESLEIEAVAVPVAENREAESPEIEAVAVTVAENRASANIAPPLQQRVLCDWLRKIEPMEVPIAFPYKESKKVVPPALAQNQLSSSMSTVPPPPTTGPHPLPLIMTNSRMRFPSLSILRSAPVHDQGHGRVSDTMQKDMHATNNYKYDGIAPAGESLAVASAAVDVGDASYQC